MTANVIKNFIEKYKNFIIQVRVDNEHLFYYNAPNNAPIIWDWDNETLMVIEPNDELMDQSGHPMQIRLVDFEVVQGLTAYVDTVTALDFINENITDEDKKKEVKAQLQKVRPAMMSPTSFRTKDYITTNKAESDSE